MKYRKFGSTDLEVSEIGLGTWQLGAPGVSTVIPGARSPQQVIQNAEASALHPLNPEEMAGIDRVCPPSNS
jgi:aryl-alcohol dehydrogenase-like predicted oxidoreductase